MRRKAEGQEARTPASSALRWVARVAIPLSFLAFIPVLSEQFEAPKAAVVRVLGCASLVLVLSSARLLGSTRWGLMDAAVLVWLAVEVATTVASDSMRISLVGEPDQREGLLTSFGFAGLYLAVRVGGRPLRDVRVLLDLVLAAAVLAGLYAGAQVVGLDPLRWTRTAGYSQITLRPFGTFGHPNLLGVVTGATASVAVVLALLDPSRRLRYGLATVVLLAATLLTLSRGAWVGMGAGILTAGILAWRAGGAAAIPRRTRWIVGAVLLVVMAAFLLDTPWRVLAARRLTDALGAGVGAGRMEIWRSAAAAWRERPIFGHGPDTFALVFPRFQTPAYWRHEWSGLPVHAHSIYLHTLATRGILGAAAVGIGFLALLVSARTAWRAGGASRLLVAAATAGLSALAVSGLSGSLGIGGTLLGFSLAAGLATLSGKAHVAHQRAASSDKVAIAAGIVAGAVMLGFATADLVASAQDREGMTLLEVSTRVKEDRVGELRRAAVKAYERATSLMPFEDGIVRRHADALRFLSAAEPDPRPWLREAEGRARRAVALAPLRALDHRFLGLVLLSQVRPSDDSRLAEGEACYERALELGPNDALTLLELVRAEVELGHPEKALRPALRVAALYPEQGETLAALANVHLALGEIDAAKVALRRSLAAEWRGDAAARQRAERTLVDLDARAK